MTHEREPFRDHLVDDEPVHVVAPGRFVDEVTDRPVSIGLTDRRLLCTFDDEEFAAISYDGICSMRSRRYTSRTVRGDRSRLLVGAGGYLAVLALFGLVLYAMVAGPTAGVAAIVLALATVLGVAAAEYVRRRTGYGVLLSEVSTKSRAESAERTAPNPSGGSARAASERASSGVPTEAAQIGSNRIPKVSGDGVAAAAGALAAAIGGLAFVTVIASVSIVVVPVLVFALLAGLALVDYGLRHEGEGDGIELVRRAETEVAVTTVDGSTFTLSVAADVELEEALNGLAFADDSDPGPTESGPTARNPSGTGTPTGSSG